MTQKVVRKILIPIQDFLKFEAAGGIILILMTVFAMIWANSPLSHLCHDMLHLPVKLQFGSLILDKTLHHWVNDGLMVIFFLSLGLKSKLRW